MRHKRTATLAPARLSLHAENAGEDMGMGEAMEFMPADHTRTEVRHRLSPLNGYDCSFA